MNNQTTLTITQTVLMDYLFNLEDWVKNIKTIDEVNSLKPKEGMMEVIKADLVTIEESELPLAKDYRTTLTYLDELSEEEYQKLRGDILSWQPTL